MEDELKKLKRELFEVRYELELAKMAQDKDKITEYNEKVKVIRSRIAKNITKQNEEKRKMK